MRKFFALFLVLSLLIPALALAAGDEAGAPQPMASVDNNLKWFVGSWSGQGAMLNMKTGQMDNSLDITTFKPIYDNKFLLYEVKGQSKGMYGKPFRGTGYFTYDPSQQKYVLYWFDNEGAHAKYVGEKNDNVLTLVSESPDGSKWSLVYTIENNRQFRLSLQAAKAGEESKSLGEITYNKVIAKTLKRKPAAPMKSY